MRTNVKRRAESQFTTLLLNWNRHQNHRQMPWKGVKDPYKIWLSEIILQQTRVGQGTAYYNKFIDAFPDIDALAYAPDEKIFKLWEGLGYYTRCRNLIATARFISATRKGVFPNSYDEILSLQGIGPYTASAISSFAFNLPYAVVDGNVFRVLARVFGIMNSTDSSVGKKIFTALAERLLDREQPGIYNQAIMDFGAVICKPLPLCQQCIFNETCSAFLNDQTHVLPVRDKKAPVKKRWFYYLVMEHGNKMAIRKRNTKDIWQDLYEFPLVESAKELEKKYILRAAVKNKWICEKGYNVTKVSPLLRQQLSHQLIMGRIINVKLLQKPKRQTGWAWITRKKAGKLAFPAFINQYFQAKP